MKLLLDMNLPPVWCERLTLLGHDACHVFGLCDPATPDERIMQLAADQQRALVTADLDFARLLAIARSTAPSVVLIRPGERPIGSLFEIVGAAIARYDAELTTGAFVVVDASSARVRMLPLR